MTDKKKSIFPFSTSSWLTVYTIFYMVLTVVACIPRLIVMFADPVWVVSHISPDFYDLVPLDVFAWGMLITFAGYCGIDRGVFAVKTSFMEMGTADYGDPKKLRKVIYLVFAVFIETLLLNLFFGIDYTLTIENTDVSVVYPGIKIPLTQIGSALASCFACYVLGNKSIRITQQIDATGGEETEIPWANEKEQKVIIKDEEVSSSEEN